MIIRPVKTGQSIDSTSFFLSQTWLSANEGRLNVIEVSKTENDKPLARFAYLSYSKLGKPMIITPPMAPHCGLEIYSKPDSASKRQTLIKRVLRSIAEELAHHKPAAYIDLNFPYEIKDIQPFKETDFDIDVAYTYLLRLDQSEENLLFSMSPERRKNIRDGANKSYETVINGDPVGVERLIADTLESRGVKPQRETIRNLLKGASDDLFWVAVWSEGKILATTIIGFDSTSAYYLAGGTVKDQNLAGPLAMWNAILESQKRGAKRFDFLGSSVPAIERYFRGFGGELTPYFRVRKNTGLIDLIKSTKDLLR